MKNLLSKIHKLEDYEFKEKMNKKITQLNRKTRKIKGKIPIESLGFKFEALKRFVDSETMSYHYNKHYIGFVNKLNDLLIKSDRPQDDIESLIKNIDKFNFEIRNNAGGAYNHSIFWKMLSTSQQEPNELLLKKIQKSFSSLKSFKKQFESACRELLGSGWVWLVISENGLSIISTEDNENPLMDNSGYPLLGLDMWEHSYYLTYKNQKEKYIENFWRVVNWDYVNERLITHQNELIESVMNDNLELIKESYSKENWGKYLALYKEHRELFTPFSSFIENILEETFPDKHRTVNGISGLYSIECDGWSVINKLNTSMLGFTILVEDINVVLKKSDIEPIKLLNPNIQREEIKSELNTLMNYIDKFKHRIFNEESKIFRKLLTALSDTTKKGDNTEDKVISLLCKKFGDTSVRKISAYGDREDMVGGIDVEVRLNGLKANAQIKPASTIVNEGNNFRVKPSSSVKQYKTDWLIFEYNDNAYLFNNKETKIVDGCYIFEKDNLLYILK